MTAVPTSAFNLSPHLAAKAAPALIAADERRFAEIAATLERSVGDVSERLDALRKTPGGSGQEALERDLEIHRLTARQGLLRRFGVDLCLGRTESSGSRAYIGRSGLTDAGGERLLVDWRAPAAEPYFAATPAHPMGLEGRRRYRFTAGRVSDYWDEAFGNVASDQRAALDDQSAFIASLGESRSPRMRDVLSTIQSDQDAIIRAGSRGALVVDGGPGTGKTVVALHRAAYLLYSDIRLAPGKGGVLFVGPHPAYLAYVEDVLPSLGESSVQMAVLRDLVPEGAVARPESDAAVGALKSSARWQAAIETAVSRYETPPTNALIVDTPWADVPLGPADWAEAFGAPEPGLTHNEARDQVWEALLEIVHDKLGVQVPAAHVRRSLAQSTELMSAFARAWPVLDPAGLVAGLWSSPGFLSACAPWLVGDEVRMLRRDDPRAWTLPDLPLLDAARRRIGDPQASAVRRRRAAEINAQRAVMERVVDDLIAADDGDLMLMSMLRSADAQNSLIDESALTTAALDLLAGPFAHVIVDEAQELTDAEWQMLVQRCPSRSFTIVGDRAQARRGFTESWTERLERIGMRQVEVASLTVNYRTPAEIMAEAEPIIRSAISGANVPVSVRSTGVPVRHESARRLGAILDEWLRTHPEGVAGVIGDGSFEETARVRSLTPETAKGLEFDLVVLVDSDEPGIEAAVDRYVAMTRATQQLVVLRRETG